MVTLLLAGNGNYARWQQFNWEIGKNREQKLIIAKKQKIVFTARNAPSRGVPTVSPDRDDTGKHKFPFPF